MNISKYIWKGNTVTKSDVRPMVQCSSCGKIINAYMRGEEERNVMIIDGNLFFACPDCGEYGGRETHHFFYGRWIKSKKKLTKIGKILNLFGFDTNHPQDKNLPEFIRETFPEDDNDES